MSLYIFILGSWEHPKIGDKVRGGQFSSRIRLAYYLCFVIRVHVHLYFYFFQIRTVFHLALLFSFTI